MGRSSVAARVLVASACLVAAWACQMSSQNAGPAAVAAPSTPEAVVPLPHAEGSLKFAVLGDFGNGERGQYQLAEQMARTQEAFPFEFVILTGDNIYGSERPQDLTRKFELPYKTLLDRNVKFYASLGNHDSREQRYYKPFNMEGKLYYSFKAPRENVRFFALESTYPEPEQIAWFENELKGSNEDWKIAFFHHPLYSSGRYHGSNVRLRRTLEPLLIKYNVSVVFAGHDHFYERVKPQQGIVHFVIGAGGELRAGNISRTTGLTARGNDTTNSFLVAEIKGDDLTFQAISRTGAILDSGVITRRRVSADTTGKP
jgi:predicted MPP superfamily phosphohydrolase